jgi:hypothetical protein
LLEKSSAAIGSTAGFKYRRSVGERRVVVENRIGVMYGRRKVTAKYCRKVGVLVF